MELISQKGETEKALLTFFCLCVVVSLNNFYRVISCNFQEFDTFFFRYKLRVVIKLYRIHQSILYFSKIHY